MTSVLVTGATGFIGSHLLPALLTSSWEIKVAVRQTPAQVIPNVVYLPVGEIGGNTDWQDSLQGINVVVHLAARAHQLNDTHPNPEQVFQEVNTLGTTRLVTEAITAGVEHFIFVSSIGAMTTSSESLLTESSLCHPNTPYGRSKLDAEQALISLANNSPMAWTILRPPLIYGPRNPGNMERLFKLVRTGIPLPLGAIRNRRSLLYVGNFVDMIMICIKNTKAKNQIFLVSDGQDLSTPELINYIAQAMGKKLLLFPVSPNLLTTLAKPFGKEDIINRLIGSLFIDNRKIRTDLGWVPPFTLTQGLQDLARWYSVKT
jgi:nucleoside-diphosphate-sugar epimerase